MSNVRVTFLGTGAGASIHRAHTAIVLDCSGGLRLLLDASSGNSVLRAGAEVGMLAQDFHQVLLSHAHADHMGGLPFIQGQRSLVDPDGAPMQVYSAEESLRRVQSLFRATSITHAVDQDGVTTSDGQLIVRWQPCQEGQKIRLTDEVWASSFLVDHIPGSVGWRVESAGVSVVFSGDTRFSENLAQASQGADLLIHEALCTDDDPLGAGGRGHSTAGEAARAATLAGVKSLILTHIDTPFHFNPQPLIDEAQRYFDGPVSLASDLHQVTVSSR
jgi:ribonuclease Z